jgi:hypothetical protein
MCQRCSKKHGGMGVAGGMNLIGSRQTSKAWRIELQRKQLSKRTKKRFRRANINGVEGQVGENGVALYGGRPGGVPANKYRQIFGKRISLERASAARSAKQRSAHHRSTPLTGRRACSASISKEGKASMWQPSWHLCGVSRRRARKAWQRRGRPRQLRQKAEAGTHQTCVKRTAGAQRKVARMTAQDCMAKELHRAKSGMAGETISLKVVVDIGIYVGSMKWLKTKPKRRMKWQCLWQPSAGLS